MNYHYVYCSYDEDFHLYIGARTSKVEPELDNYFGSFKDKTFKPIGKWVLGCFFNRRDAISYEIHLHELWNVAVNPLFINKAKQTSGGWDTTGTTKEISDETRTRISEAQKLRHILNPQYGRVLSDETKRKIGEAHRGKKNGSHSEETRKKMRDSARKYQWFHPEHGHVYCNVNELCAQFFIKNRRNIADVASPKSYKTSFNSWIILLIGPQ